MKMSKRAEKALRQSIDRKWIPVRDAGAEENGSDDCALCELYAENGCRSCPVFLKTGLDGCVGTPFMEWRDHHISRHLDMIVAGHGFKVQCEECHRLSDKEVKFLQSLLPKEDE